MFALLKAKRKGLSYNNIHKQKFAIKYLNPPTYRPMMHRIKPHTFEANIRQKESFKQNCIAKFVRNPFFYFNYQKNTIIFYFQKN